MFSIKYLTFRLHDHNIMQQDCFVPDAHNYIKNTALYNVNEAPPMVSCQAIKSITDASNKFLKVIKTYKQSNTLWQDKTIETCHPWFYKPRTKQRIHYAKRVRTSWSMYTIRIGQKVPNSAHPTLTMSLLPHCKVSYHLKRLERYCRLSPWSFVYSALGHFSLSLPMSTKCNAPSRK